MPGLRCGLVLLGGIVEPEGCDRDKKSNRTRAGTAFRFVDIIGTGGYIRLLYSGDVSDGSHSPELGAAAAHDLVLAH
jgi:hypothetical protein